MPWDDLLKDKKNIVFLGESGCGKSELALNLAMYMAKKQNKEIHFFDMDQTKPLFRSRDIKGFLEKNNVFFHYEEQTADAPTMVGGVVPLLLDQKAHVIMDVGGGDTGARLIGGFSHVLKRNETMVLYIVNPYRPWSGDIFALDATLSAILKAARIQKIHFLLNPNLGVDTTASEFLEGLHKGIDMLSPYVTVEAVAVTEKLAAKVENRVTISLIPIQTMLSYPWQDM